MSNESVYILESDYDNPRYTGLNLLDDAPIAIPGQARCDSLRCNFIKRRSAELHRRDWQVVRLAPFWRPRDVCGRVGDFAMFSTAIPVFSQRAVDALRDMLEPNGELLPLAPRQPLGPFYAFNVTTIADALDANKSDIAFLPDGVTAISIVYHVFRADRVAPFSIFRVPESAILIYVTEKFVLRVREHGLEGFSFKKAWPLLRGENWRFHRSDTSRPKREKANASVKRTPLRKASRRGNLIARSLSDKEQQSLETARQHVAAELGIDLNSMTPDQIQTWVFQSLETLRTLSANREREKDRAFWLAIAWGETLIRKLNWEWQMIQSPKGEAWIAVVSPKREYAVLPLQFIDQIAVGEKSDNTSQLLFNMIVGRTVSPAMPGALLVLG